MPTSFDPELPLTSAYYDQRRTIASLFGFGLGVGTALYGIYILLAGDVLSAAIIFAVAAVYGWLVARTLGSAQALVQEGKAAVLMNKTCTVCGGCGLISVRTNSPLSMFMPPKPNTVVHGCTACPACGPVPPSRLNQGTLARDALRAQTRQFLAICDSEGWDHPDLQTIREALNEPRNLRPTLEKLSESSSWVGFQARNALAEVSED